MMPQQGETTSSSQYSVFVDNHSMKHGKVCVNCKDSIGGVNSPLTDDKNLSCRYNDGVVRRRSLLNRKRQRTWSSSCDNIDEGIPSPPCSLRFSLQQLEVSPDSFDIQLLDNNSLDNCDMEGYLSKVDSSRDHFGDACLVALLNNKQCHNHHSLGCHNANTSCYQSESAIRQPFAKTSQQQQQPALMNPRRNKVSTRRCTYDHLWFGLTRAHFLTIFLVGIVAGLTIKHPLRRNIVSRYVQHHYPFLKQETANDNLLNESLYATRHRHRRFSSTNSYNNSSTSVATNSSASTSNTKYTSSYYNISVSSSTSSNATSTSGKYSNTYSSSNNSSTSSSATSTSGKYTNGYRNSSSSAASYSASSSGGKYSSSYSNYSSSATSSGGTSTSSGKYASGYSNSSSSFANCSTTSTSGKYGCSNSSSSTTRSSATSTSGKSTSGYSNSSSSASSASTTSYNSKYSSGYNSSTGSSETSNTTTSNHSIAGGPTIALNPNKGLQQIQSFCKRNFIRVSSLRLLCNSPGAYYLGSNAYRKSDVCQAGDRANLEIEFEVTERMIYKELFYQVELGHYDRFQLLNNTALCALPVELVSVKSLRPAKHVEQTNTPTVSPTAMYDDDMYQVNSSLMKKCLNVTGLYRLSTNYTVPKLRDNSFHYTPDVRLTFTDTRARIVGCTVSGPYSLKIDSEKRSRQGWIALGMSCILFVSVFTGLVVQSYRRDRQRQESSSNKDQRKKPVIAQRKLDNMNHYQYFRTLPSGQVVRLPGMHPIAHPSQQHPYYKSPRPVLTVTRRHTKPATESTENQASHKDPPSSVPDYLKNIPNVSSDDDDDDESEDLSHNAGSRDVVCNPQYNETQLPTRPVI